MTSPSADGAASAASGDEAIAAAEVRAAATRGRNLPVLDGLPVPDDTANLRQGADLHPDLLVVLPLVGVWRGTGEASYPTTEPYHFGQQLVVAHDGRGFLTWESRTWVLDDNGAFVRPADRESGFWRVQARDDGEDTLELLLSHSSGIVEVYYGAAISQAAWELATDVVIRTSSATEITSGTRLYGIVDGGDLAWVQERAMASQPLQPHLSARLTRHVG